MSEASDRIRDLNPHKDTWRKFRQAIKNELRNNIKLYESRKKEATKKTREINKELKVLEKELETVDEKCTKANQNFDYLISIGKKRLNGRSALAINRRELSHVVGLCQCFTTVSHTFNRLKMQEQWWCDGWFLDFLEQIDRSQLSRTNMYKYLDNVSNLQTRQDIEREIGLLVLSTL